MEKELERIQRHNDWTAVQQNPSRFDLLTLKVTHMSWSEGFYGGSKQQYVLFQSLNAFLFIICDLAS